MGLHAYNMCLGDWTSFLLPCQVQEGGDQTGFQPSAVPTLLSNENTSEIWSNKLFTSINHPQFPPAPFVRHPPSLGQGHELPRDAGCLSFGETEYRRPCRMPRPGMAWKAPQKGKPPKPSRVSPRSASSSPPPPHSPPLAWGLRELAPSRG